MDRKEYRGRIVVALALVLAAASWGCTPQVEVESNLDPEYHADLERLFVVIDTHKIDQATRRISDRGDEFGGGESHADTTSFMRVFLPALAEHFEAVGVEIKGHAVSTLALAPDDVAAKIQAYGPDAVLHINESWYQVQRDPGILGLGATEDVTAIDLDCTLTDERFPDRAVWRALVQVKGQAGTWKAMAEELALSVVDQLTVDGLIDPATKSSKSPAKGEGGA